MNPLVDWAQSTPGAALTDIYTCPTSRKANGVMYVSNIAGASKTFRVAVSRSGAAIANSHYLAYDETLAANDRTTIAFKVKATDVIRVYGSDANVVFGWNYYEDDQ